MICSVERLNSQFYVAEERISKLKDRIIDKIQEQEKMRMKKWPSLRDLWVPLKIPVCI